jgi:hypothetical protein
MKEQPGGLKAVLNAVGGKIHEVGYLAGQKFQHFRQAAIEKWQDQPSSSPDKNQKIADESDAHSPELEQLLGRRVNKSVRATNGLWVAAAGQIITPRVLDQAHRLEKERDLFEALEGPAA